MIKAAGFLIIFLASFSGSVESAQNFSYSYLYSVIPGCPSILDVLSQTDPQLEINCVCDIDNDAFNDSLVSVACFNVTDLSDLVTAAAAVRKVGKILYSVGVNGSQLSSDSLHGDFFKRLGDTPQLFAVRLCPEDSQPLKFDDNFLRNADINKIKSFEIVDCPFSADGTVPKFVRQMKKLRRLVMSDAGLKKIQAGDFEGLSDLEILTMNVNGIESIDANSFKDSSNLRKLHVNFNMINESMLAFLNPLKNLLILDLSNNFINSLSPDSFANNNQLENVFLSSNYLKSLPANLFTKMAQLTLLHLNLNQLSEKGFPTNAKVFPPSLRLLDLASNNMADIPDFGILGAPNITFLTLTNNDISSVKIGRLQSLHNLHSLLLDSNFELISIEKGAFKSLPQLHYLDLSHDNVTNFESADYFDQNNSVNYLSLQDNALGNVLTAKSFGALPNLLMLDLSQNGLTYLPQGTLDPLKNITSLNLSDNAFQCDKNITYLVQWLRKNLSNERLAADFRMNSLPACYTPIELQGLPLVAVSTDQLS